MDLKQLIHDDTWKENLSESLTSANFSRLGQFLEKEYKNHTIYPPKEDIFNAFNLTPFKKIRVVILGQDPYHGPSQAHGLAFSVKSPSKPPPSLRNIFKELNISPQHGDLTSWAEQGVFLLNTALTVRQSQANSHQKQGWEEFTDDTIRAISEYSHFTIFVLWGKPAEKKEALIDTGKHIILKSAHPSPLSAHRGFLGCGHFTTINKELKKRQLPIIDWNLPNHQPWQPELI